MMGLLNQLKRSVRNMVRNFIRSLFGKKRRSSRKELTAPPKSWMKKQLSNGTNSGSAVRTVKVPVRKGAVSSLVVSSKRRIPGLRQFNRILAGFLLLINFIFSQFLLGSVGAAAQPIFLLFLGNCYIIIRYLWSSRKQEK